MSSEFSQLGLDYDTVRQNLFDLGIIDSVDDTTYTEGELANLMFVADLMLGHTIEEKSVEVEGQLVNYHIQKDRLEGLNSVFANLRDFLAPAGGLADAQDLVDFIESETRLFNLDDTAVVPIDYAVTRSDGSEAVTYENLQDYQLAVEDNTQLNNSGTTVLSLEYDVFEDQGLFGGIYTSSGTQIGDSVYGIQQLLAGNAYLKVASTGTFTPDVYLDAAGFQNFAIAVMLQEQGYIGAEVNVIPVVFADTNQPSISDGTVIGGSPIERDAGDWIEWNQLYFGKLTVASDADAGTLTVDYNGTAGLYEMGITPSEFFEEASITYEVVYTDKRDTSPDAEEFTREETLSPASDYYLIAPADDESYWMLLTGMYAFGTYQEFVAVSNDTFDSTNFETQSFTALDAQWSDVAGNGLAIEDYLEGNLRNNLLETAATAVEGESALGQVSLLELSTSITEWSDLHGSWDTVHKYTTDAAERSIAAMK